MKALELEQALKDMPLASLYVITGEEDYLRDQSLARIKAAVMAAMPSSDEGGEGFHDTFNSDVFYGDETDASEILASVESISVFAPRRLVVLKGAEKLPARETEALIPYLKAPSESTTLVVVATKLDGRLKFTQALKERALVVDCAPPPDYQLHAWVREEARRVGVRLSDEAVQLLKEVAGESLYLVRRELEKLAALVPEGAVAGSDEVEALRGGEPGASVFDLTAAIGARDAARALRILARNLEAGEAPLRILGSLLWQYRRLWKAKELAQHGTSDLARALGIPPFRVKDFVAQVRVFSEAHLRTAFQWFAETDSKLKGGSAGSPERVLQVLLLRLCEGQAEPAAAGQPGRAATPSPPPVGPQPEGTPRPPARRGGTKAIPTVRTVRTIRPKEPPAR